MPTPTYNKWKSTTIYGNLSVRDLTNSAGTSVVEAASVDLSGNFLSRGNSTFTKAVTCNGTISNNSHLATKLYVDNAVSGSSILGLNNTFSGENTFSNINYFNKEITQEFAPLGTYVNKFLSTAFLESVVFKSFSQDGSAANTLDNLTLGGASSSGGLILAYNAGITQTSTGTNTLKNLTINDGIITIKNAIDEVVFQINLNDWTGNINLIGSLSLNAGLFPNEISQTDYIGVGNSNRFIRSIMDEQTEMYSIVEAKTGTQETGLRVATGDYPYLPTNSPYTTPQVFTIAAQQTIAGSQLTINQTTTSATNTANYAIANTIISNFTIPTNFSKNITLNIPISLRNAGTWTLTGTALNATITNTINSMTASIYNNGSLWGTATITALNSNSLTRTTTIGYTTTGTKTIALDQYFFNINIDTTSFFYDTYISRDNSTSNVVQIVLSMNITNSITKNTNTGNFTATNTLTLVSNTSTSTISNTGTAATTITYSPNSNGTNYAAATSTSTYNDTSLTTGGTTYTNHLRANTFNLLPAGIVIAYTASTAPYGWLLCDGTAYNASTNKEYQALYDVIGITFGGTNNTNFKVPDYTGAFLRGAGTKTFNAVSYDGGTINTAQADQMQSGGVITTRGFRSTNGGVSGGVEVKSRNRINGDPDDTSTANGTSLSFLRQGTDVRPYNFGVQYIIKY